MFIRHFVTYLQTIWHYFSDSDIAIPTFMFLNKDIGFVFCMNVFHIQELSKEPSTLIH